MSVDNINDDDEMKMRLLGLYERIKVAEEKVAIIEDSLLDHHPIERIKQEIMKYYIYTGRFHYVSNDYYELTLDRRALQLSCSVPQLCKSIIFENTAYVDDNNYNVQDHYDSSSNCLSNGSSEYERVIAEENNYRFFLKSRYYCVITQYICKPYRCVSLIYPLDDNDEY